MTPQRFSGKVAVVTGAGAGIGRAVAVRLAAEGAAVAVLDLAAAAAADTVAAITDAGGQALAVAADVASPDDVHAGVRSTVAAFGGIDVLVNNAGVVRYGTVPELSVEDWHLTLATNLTGTFLTCKYAIPEMRARGGGAIVNTASAQAFASQPLVAAYAASKGAVVAMTRSLAVDHAADGIRVTCVCPGSVETPMLRYGAELLGDGDAVATMRDWGRQHPIGRLIQPSDVAALVAFLASDDAVTITGAPYLVDGGLLARLGV
ncbi:SDR family NAD(P)-dependent oxidoreductase [Jiangella mangrovi]|uniref:NAD(P)-dependent dehydrogenase (Short-subunit alcohol dehydrogenase family) n=1 Tax=Jiangella mangrovi TaxID=1524084 RepID=A0A7W9LPB3_9ACTN|nr:SDR family NAD(P)-dependent oxidoreductase [Jiangella mangrovi]MBB5791126.1 NAD(P)-dependent dehydrogenase (short-subunit alcohol dehydrogenase family) [Jiangella mangrovi]